MRTSGEPDIAVFRFEAKVSFTFIMCVVYRFATNREVYSLLIYPFQTSGPGIMYLVLLETAESEWEYLIAGSRDYQ